MALLQTVPDITSLFERLGIPLAILVAIGVGAWRGVWPYVKARAEKQDALIQAQFDRVQNQQDTTLKEIVAALQSSGHTQERTAEHLKELTQELRRRIK